ncbi:DUF899 family protein [Sphingomonas psychrotolerans]|uniref:DUF899 domain-containing protein n=1 Tax=Sphingomonas psychrotolerans TaxID=1327635 RepID=A0A2K8MF45_9SPHN|nr:DUF899 family protein [Sphingomonas psychrotolerans]ATY32497.1 DUF899 domain-containing protein [Sphingomonas psychrotolerans]
MIATILPPAEVLAARCEARWAGESAEYRAARTALLAEEIALRRHIEHVAEQRRALPAGPAVTRDYSFEGPEGAVTLAELFGDKETLVVYTWMYGPQRERPCPMCTSLLSAWEGEALDIRQRVALAVTARSPLDKLEAFAAERGWRHLPLYSDVNGDFSRDYNAITPEGDDIPQLLVFTRRDGTIRFFWAGEMDDSTADPGQDPRGAPDLMPLWTILDSTPEGRGADWYPSLTYPAK